MQLGKLKTIDFLKWNKLYWFNYMIRWRSRFWNNKLLFCFSLYYLASVLNTFFFLSIGIWTLLRMGYWICYLLALVSVFKSFNSNLVMDCRTSLALVVCPCIHAVVVHMMHSCDWLLCAVSPGLHQNSYFLVSGFRVWLHLSI